MRPIESLLLVVDLALLVFRLATQGTPARLRLASAIPILVLAGHLGIEGYRWQMAPGYLATGILLLVCLWQGLAKCGWWAGATVCVCLLGAALLGTIMPVFQFPEPTGPFPIGSVTHRLVDVAREETQGGREGGRRELMVQVWYPADHAGPRQYYRTNTPSKFRNEHLRLVRVHSASGVPVAQTQSRYPVLVFSPAWTGNCNQYTCLAEDLASHGFIVVGIDHPYGSDPTTFPDGRVVRSVLAEQFLDYSSEESLEATIRAAEAQLAIRTADVRFVLDELERLDSSDPNGLFIGRIDASRVGAFGHSFGGAVAVEVCRTDPRVKACVDLDGLLFGAPTRQGLGKPFMYISDDRMPPTPVKLQALEGASRRHWDFITHNVHDIRRALSRAEGCWLTIKGAWHLNFTDGPFYTPLKSVTGAGPIRPERALAIVNAYVLAFFQANLDARDAPLLDGNSPDYPEVEFERLSKEKS